MIGIDIVKISRIEGFISRYGDKALQKFLHTSEIALGKSSQSYAGYWAAKEALSKALDTGIGKNLSFHDILIHKTDEGSPYLTLPKALVDKRDILDISLSITHDDGYAIAVVAIVSKEKSYKKLYH